MQTSLNITYADSSLKKSTKSLTYINPEATNTQLETAASLFSAISQNDYVGAERIDRMNVTEPSPYPTPKTEPTFNVTASSANDHFHNFDYDGDGELSANYKFVTVQGGTADNGFTMINTGTKVLRNWEVNSTGQASMISNFAGTINVYSPETENYAAKEFTVTVQSGSV